MCQTSNGFTVYWTPSAGAQFVAGYTIGVYYALGAGDADINLEQNYTVGANAVSYRFTMANLGVFAVQISAFNSLGQTGGDTSWISLGNSIYNPVITWDYGRPDSHAHNQRQTKPVVSLAANGLDGGRAHAILPGQQIVEPPNALHAFVGAVGLDDRAIADDIVDDDRAAHAGEAKGPLEILGRADLVGINEDKIKRSLAGQRRQGLDGGADADIDTVGQPGNGDVFGRHRRVFRLEFQRDEPAILWQRPRQPDGAVSAEGADLEDLFRPVHAGQQVQQFALVGRDIDRRQPRGGARLQAGIQCRIGRHDQIAEVFVDGGPLGLGHGFPVEQTLIADSFGVQRLESCALNPLRISNQMRVRPRDVWVFETDSLPCWLRAMRQPFSLNRREASALISDRGNLGKKTREYLRTGLGFQNKFEDHIQQQSPFVITIPMTDKGKGGVDTARLAALLAEFKELEAAGAGRVGHADNDKRNNVLDEMQDVAGLAGRMVMERDILKKAELLLQEPRTK